MCDGADGTSLTCSKNGDEEEDGDPNHATGETTHEEDVDETPDSRHDQTTKKHSVTNQLSSKQYEYGCLYIMIIHQEARTSCRIRIPYS